MILVSSGFTYLICNDKEARRKMIGEFMVEYAKQMEHVQDKRTEEKKKRMDEVRLKRHVEVVVEKIKRNRYAEARITLMWVKRMLMQWERVPQLEPWCRAAIGPVLQECDNQFIKIMLDEYDTMTLDVFKERWRLAFNIIKTQEDMDVEHEAYLLTKRSV